MVLKIYITFQSKYQNSINLCHQQPDKRLYDTTCFPSLANLKKNQNENNFYSNGNNHTIYIRYFLIFNIETNQRKILKSIQQCLGISIYRETHLKTFSAIDFFFWINLLSPDFCFHSFGYDTHVSWPESVSTKREKLVQENLV